MSHLTNNRIVLIGDKQSKRYTYFEKACEDLDCPFTFMDYDEIALKDGDCIKIDPPSIKAHDLSSLQLFIDHYKQTLLALSKQENVVFLNHPNDIMLCLDKYECKKRLQHLPCTPLIDNVFVNADALFAYLSQNNISQVFVKPRYGSGASGIIALRYQKKTKHAIIYTTLVDTNNGYYNGTKTTCIRDMDKIIPMLEFVLSLDAMIENWLPKKKYNGLSYDLRVVMLKDRMLRIVPRGSKTPITNLHLNNMPLPVEIVENTDKIELLCKQVMKTLPNLSYAGIDLLVTPSGKFFVIEVNGQGDAIYQDFYEHNDIYKQQIILLKTKGESNYGQRNSF